MTATAAEKEVKERPMTVKPLTALRANPNNPRGEVIDDDSLRELAASIKALGVLQPILVTPCGLIVAGHRRAKAAEIAGLESIPAIERNLSEIEQIEIMLVENMQRADLNVVQEGQAFLKLQGHGLTHEEIAKAVGLCVQTVKKRVIVASLAPECWPAFISGQLPQWIADRLLPLPKAKQIYWAEKAIREELNGSALAQAMSATSNRKSLVVIPSDDEIRIEKLNHLLDRLERIDKELDSFAEMRRAQTAIRQSMSAIVDGMTRKGRTHAA